MEQPLEDSPGFEGSPTIALKYPTVTVYGSPSSWLSQSQLVSMASNPDDISGDDTSSSLGDSTYEFIDDKSTVVSDDEEQGSSAVFSTDGRYVEPQSNHGLQRRDSASEQGSQSSYAEPSNICFDLDSSLATISTSNYVETDQNGHGTRSNGCQDTFEHHNQEGEQAILLIESTIKPAGPTVEAEGSCTTRVWCADEIPDVSRQLPQSPPPNQVAVTVKQTMVSHGLVLDQPYKVLYIGDNSARDQVIQKIGSALAATLESEKPRPSRFNIVPISSFGDSTSPEVVLIDSTGLELSVEECHSASFVKLEGGNDTISMTISDRTLVESFWSGSKFSVTDHWKLPDIAIFYLSENDNISSKQTRRFARSFMNRHFVPCIFISQSPYWNYSSQEIIALDPKTPHLCLQAVESGVKKSETIKRMPIDLQSFLSLDCRQVNRNLACLATIYHTGYSKPESTDPSRSPLTKAEKSSKDNYRAAEKILTIEKILRSGLLLVLGFLLYQLAVSNVFNAPQTYRQNTKDAAAVPTILLTRPSSVLLVSTKTGLTKSPVLTSSPRNQYLTPRSGSPQANTEIASFLQDDQGLLPKNSDKFKISVLGDSHILLRPPHWFIRSRKAPKLSFRVSRGTHALNHQVSTPFDGVFTIEIPRDDAYGLLNVSIWTTANPKIEVSFEVEFGSSCWSRAGHAVIGFLRKDIAFVNTGLTAISNQTTNDFRLMMGWVYKEASKFLNTIENTGTASLDQTAKATDLVLARTRSISRSLSRLSHGTLVTSKQLLLCAKHLQPSHTARRINFTNFTNPINYKNKHLRSTQKRALKLWWRIRGVPKQDFVKGGIEPKTQISACTKRTSR